MTTKPLKQGATYDDLRRVPDHYVAEIFDGDLYASPRPALPHARAATVLGAELGGPFDFGRNGPGGWFLLGEPELHFGDDVLVPDRAGWRRKRLPALPSAAFMTAQTAPRLLSFASLVAGHRHRRANLRAVARLVG